VIWNIGGGGKEDSGAVVGQSRFCLCCECV